MCLDQPTGPLTRGYVGQQINFSDQLTCPQMVDQVALSTQQDAKRDLVDLSELLSDVERHDPWFLPGWVFVAPV